jgi:hypothetical protein
MKQGETYDQAYIRLDHLGRSGPDVGNVGAVSNGTGGGDKKPDQPRRPACGSGVTASVARRGTG